MKEQPVAGDYTYVYKGKGRKLGLSGRYRYLSIYSDHLEILKAPFLFIIAASTRGLTRLIASALSKIFYGSYQPENGKLVESIPYSDFVGYARIKSLMRAGKVVRFDRHEDNISIATLWDVSPLAKEVLLQCPLPCTEAEWDW